MIVFIGGMPRSGSTFSFNIARETLLRLGDLHQEATPDVMGAVVRAQGRSHVLVKAHALNGPSLALARAGAMRIIMTVRRVEDAIASWQRTFDASERDTVQVMHDWFGLFRQLQRQSLIVPYWQIERHPWLAAWRIARAIYPGAEPCAAFSTAFRFRKAAVKRRTDALLLSDDVTDLGFSYYDNKTFFHRRHVSGPPSCLRPASQERLTSVLATLAPEIDAAGLPV